jgi:hypothetical protein
MAGFEVTLYGRIWVTPEAEDPSLIVQVAPRDRSTWPFRMIYAVRIRRLSRRSAMLTRRTVYLVGDSRGAKCACPGVLRKSLRLLLNASWSASLPGKVVLDVF